MTFLTSFLFQYPINFLYQKFIINKLEIINYFNYHFIFNLNSIFNYRNLIFIFMHHFKIYYFHYFRKD